MKLLKYFLIFCFFLLIQFEKKSGNKVGFNENVVGNRIEIKENSSR